MVKLKTDPLADQDELTLSPVVETSTRFSKIDPEEIPDRIVRGIFKNIESPGCSLKFSFRDRPGPIRTFNLDDGKIYEIPYAVAVHLNRNCFLPVHSTILDKEGKPTKHTGKVNHRFSFQSLEFV